MKEDKKMSQEDENKGGIGNGLFLHFAPAKRIHSE